MTEGRAEEHEIEGPRRHVRLRCVSEDCCHVHHAHLGCFELEPVDHARLNVNPHRLAAGQDALRRWDEQAARSGSYLQDSLPWLESETAKRGPSTPLGDGVVNHPPRGMAATKSGSPSASQE
jgi:hypothetical protein